MQPGAVARSNERSSGMRTVADSILTFGEHSSWRFGHEKNSSAILSLPLIQEGQLSVIGERMCIKYWQTA